MGKLKFFITSKKIAILVSYAGIVLHTFSNLLLTPLYLNYLGKDVYGVYQMVYSMAHYILILDIGISTTMVRYISKYRTDGDKKGEENFAAHCLSLSIVIIFLICVAGGIINFFLTDIYTTIPSIMHPVAHRIFLIMVGTLVTTIIERFLSGILMAYEHFSVVHAITIVKILLKIFLTYGLLELGLGMDALAIADLVVELLVVVFFAIYGFGFLRFRISFSKFDRQLLLSIFGFMIALFLQSVASYANNMADKTILGIMTTAGDVAVFSVATNFITMFNSLPTAVTNVFLPQATRLVSKNPDKAELTEFVSRPGRYQFMLCGALLCGFALFGREFIVLWVGQDMLDAWLIALIIMVPNMVPLIQNAVLCILDAKKKRLFRSIVLLALSMVHIIISVVLVRYVGVMGAPIGSAVSYIVGYGIIMNIYYHKKIGINVPVLFKTIVSKSWICLIITTAIAWPTNLLFPNESWITLIVKVLWFCVVYAGLLYLYGFNENEKKDVFSFLGKLVHK